MDGKGFLVSDLMGDEKEFNQYMDMIRALFKFDGPFVGDKIIVQELKLECSRLQKAYESDDPMPLREALELSNSLLTRVGKAIEKFPALRESDLGGETNVPMMYAQKKKTSKSLRG